MSKTNDGYPYEPFIQAATVKYLASIGYSQNIKAKKLREHGVDIRVKNNKYSRYWLIECKGGPRRAKHPNASAISSFWCGLGQILTRIHSKTQPTGASGSNKYGIAYPDYFKDKFLKKIHWHVCKQLNLYFFFVDPHGHVEMYDWQRIKQEFPDA